MRFVMLFAATIAVACFAVPARAATIFHYLAVGSAYESFSSSAGANNRTYDAWSQGYIIFDPPPGAASFTQSDITAVAITVTGSVDGDQLLLHYRSFLNSTNNVNITFALTFEPGYLGAAFPTTLDFGRLLSGQISYYEIMGGASSLSTFFTGSVVGLSSGMSNSLRPGGAGQVIAGVPEPATWLSLILGFGLLGGALRRQAASSNFRIA